MKDYPLDIVNTLQSPMLHLVKVTGTDSATTIEGLAEDPSVIHKQLQRHLADLWAHLVNQLGQAGCYSIPLSMQRMQTFNQYTRTQW